MDNNFGSFLKKRAFQTPDREGYVDSHSGERLTFLSFNERSNRIANALLAVGVNKGERVGLLMMNNADYFAIYYALAKIGAVMVPLNWRLVSDELEYILCNSGVSRLIFEDAFLSTVNELHARSGKTKITQWLQVNKTEKLAPYAESYFDFRDSGSAKEPPCLAGGEDRLLIVYTSGTTGLPKGVVHTHNSVIWATLNLDANSSFREHDKYLTALPMFHTGALTPLSVNFYRGVTSVVMPGFDAEIAWKAIERERISTGFMVPTMLDRLLQVDNFRNRYDFSSMRWMMSGGSPVTITMIRSFSELGIHILQAYGLTESCGMTSIMDVDAAMEKPESIGKATFHVDVRVVNEAGEDCRALEMGEVIVRGESIFREYWNNPKSTQDAIRDGWLHTGDLGVMDTDGYVFIRDRKKGMIISGGENIYPAEIEKVLLTHAKIAEAAVIGQASARWGESPLAIVVRNDDSLTKEEVLGFCRTKLAGYKLPKGVEFVESLPRNSMGKVLKHILKDQYPGAAAE